MEGAGKKNAALQLDGLRPAEQLEIGGLLPDAVLPHGTGDERVVVTGNEVNRTGEGAEDLADLTNEEAVHGVVLEDVASQDDHLGAVIAGRLDDAFRGLEPFLTHTLGEAPDRFGLHADLPVRGVEEFHGLGS